MKKLSRLMVQTLLMTSSLCLFYAPTVSAAKVAAAPQSQAVTDSEKITSDKVNINTASAEELAAGLKGIGLKKAQNIVNYREQYGVFSHIEQLQEVPGIGAAIFEQNLAKLAL